MCTGSARKPLKASSSRTMEDQLVQADLHDIALNKLVTRDAHAVHKGTGGGVMILYLVAAIAHFADGGVQAAHRQVFEENVAIAAASDGRFAQQLKAAYHAAHIREVQFGNRAVVRVGFFPQLRLAPA